MSDCEEVFPVTASRKKRRGSGFRFSSRKVLDRSRLKRLAKARGCEVTSVTRTLTYPSLVPSEECSSDTQGRAATPSESPNLVSIVEFEEERKENSHDDQLINFENPISVSVFIWYTLCVLLNQNCVSYV